MSDFEVYLSFDEMPVDEVDPVADGKDSLLVDAPWANPDAAPLTTKAEKSLLKRLDSHAEARAKAAKPKPPKLVVPHPRDLHDGAKPSTGWDVYALQRALSKAKLRKWGVFTRVYGPGTYRQVRRFQQTHGLHVDGVYGVQTHKKLAPFYDAHGIWLINRVHIQTPAELRRARLLTAAQVMYNRGSIVHYTQGPNRMWIVRHRYTLAQLSTMPVDYEDCSSGVTALYYVAGLEDPNRLNYNGQGFTGTLGAHGTPIGPGQAKVGALYFYGSPPYDHVTINVGVDRCWSQGNEYAPDILNPWYRNVSATHEYGGLP